MNVTLSHDQLEQLADLVAQKLAARHGELVDATELARRLNRSREFIYAHSEALGALRLGSGPKPRLMFPWPLHHGGDVGHREVAKAQPKPRRSDTTVPLLPIGRSSC